MADFSLPPQWLLEEQAAWLAAARSRLLRRVHVARRRRLLDLACGHGAVSGELARRGGGVVVALDRHFAALAGPAERFAGAWRVCGDAAQLPLGAETFDLVFCQFALLWLDVPSVLAEVRRVLVPGGVLVALEPDYGGMMEHPPEIATRALWMSALTRCGADPEVGRKLPGMLAAAGFSVRVDLLERLLPPSPHRFRFLEDLPLNDCERQALQQAKEADAQLDDSRRVAHLPVFLVTGTRQ